MKIQPEFTDQELKEIQEALRVASMHSSFSQSQDYWHNLSLKIDAMRKLSKALNHM